MKTINFITVDDGTIKDRIITVKVGKEEIIEAKDLLKASSWTNLLNMYDVILSTRKVSTATESIDQIIMKLQEARRQLSEKNLQEFLLILHWFKMN